MPTRGRPQLVEVATSTSTSEISPKTSCTMSAASTRAACPSPHSLVLRRRLRGGLSRHARVWATPSTTQQEHVRSKTWGSMGSLRPKSDSTRATPASLASYAHVFPPPPSSSGKPTHRVRSMTQQAMTSITTVGQTTTPCACPSSSDISTSTAPRATPPSDVEAMATARLRPSPPTPKTSTVTTV